MYCYIISCHLYSSFCFQALRGVCNMRHINIYYYYYLFHFLVVYDLVPVVCPDQVRN